MGNIRLLIWYVPRHNIANPITVSGSNVNVYVVLWSGYPCPLISYNNRRQTWVIVHATRRIGHFLPFESWQMYLGFWPGNQLRRTNGSNKVDEATRWCSLIIRWTFVRRVAEWLRYYLRGILGMKNSSEVYIPKDYITYSSAATKSKDRRMIDNVHAT